MSVLKSYRKAVAYVESFSNTSCNYQNTRPDPGIYISRTKHLLSLVGNPDKKIEFIHVTGTAGKGTVSAMIHAGLVLSEKKVGLFNSPYITSVIDQIKVGEEYISPKDFARILEKIKPCIEKVRVGKWGQPLTFEILFVIALLYFEEKKCNWAVIEVGIGGRFDATNVISNVKVAVITNIDYDHTKILGKTLTRIANDKIGILKSGSVLFTSEQRSHLKKIFVKNSKKLGVKCNFVERQKDYVGYNQILTRKVLVFLGLQTDIIDRAIKNTVMPCRFEVIQKIPTVILDGAHNRSKIKSTIDKVKQIKYNQAHVLVAIGNTSQDQLMVIKQLIGLPRLKKIIITKSGTVNRLTCNPNKIVGTLGKFLRKSDNIIIENDPDLALNSLMSCAAKDDLILVTGSFFLSGYLRRRWISEEWVLKNLKSFK